jgi:hypothetical protein
MEIETSEWVTLKEAMRITGQNAMYIHRLMDAGAIKILDIWKSKGRLYFKKDVQKFIKNIERKS